MVANNRPADFAGIFENENIRVIPKLGSATASKLEEIGITQVVQLKDLSELSVDILSCLNVCSLKAILCSADSSLPGSFLYTVIDYCLVPNPYKSRYGTTWKQTISSIVAMSPFFCVTALVEYMLRKSTRVMHSTAHLDYGYFYYNALSIMTTCTTIAWIKEKCWLVA